MINARGTQYDIPGDYRCNGCHARTTERVLGFAAVQLAHSKPGITLAGLETEGLLTDPPSAPFTMPGDATAQAALGYLHGNCANCHNEDGIELATPYSLRVHYGDVTVQDTDAWNTAVDVPVESFVSAGVHDRITPGDPDHSCVTVRMGQRGKDQMPPVGTELVDTEGLAAVRAWIQSLP